MTLPLVFIHGWGQHKEIWQPLLAGLPATQDILNLELPGHGDAPWQAFDLDILVDAYAAQAPAQCVVVGWSLGGLVALRWAQHHPQQVRKLALLGSTPCFGQRSDWPCGSPDEVQQAFALHVAEAPERALQRFADLAAEGEHDPRSVRRALRAHLAERPIPHTEALLAGLRFLAETDMRASLQKRPVTQPTLLLHGEGDTITAFAASAWLADNLPQARLHALPQCGHAPMVSHADEARTALLAFLDE